MNKYCLYPVGHPEVITEGFKDIKDYFGFVKCKILPPKKLHLPVLPYRSNGKLMFPLCRICTETLQQTPCTHSDEERSLTGTWVTEEVKLALSEGYRLVKVYILKYCFFLYFLFSNRVFIDILNVFSYIFRCRSMRCIISPRHQRLSLGRTSIYFSRSNKRAVVGQPTAKQKSRNRSTYRPT